MERLENTRCGAQSLYETVLFRKDTNLKSQVGKMLRKLIAEGRVVLKGTEYYAVANPIVRKKFVEDGANPTEAARRIQMNEQQRRNATIAAAQKAQFYLKVWDNLRFFLPAASKDEVPKFHICTSFGKSNFSV